jgi:hypothetical protein
MRIVRALGWSRWAFLGILIYGGWFLLLPTPALAQCSSNTVGFNAVWSNCTNQVKTQGGFAMVDATQFTNTTDICAAMVSIYATYNPNNSNGVVIDARGFPGPTLTCSQNPWNSSLWQQKFSSVVLLPAGTINLSTTLTLPRNTRLVGEGSGLTVLKACATATGCLSNFSGDMIDMGNSTVCIADPHTGLRNCPAVVIEHLALDGTGQHLSGLKGIVNTNSQELSRVDDVTLTNFTGGIGLSLGYRSNNSGPYTNISYSGNGVCAQIYGGIGGALGTSTPVPPINQTRGIHGLTCIMTGTSSPAAVYLDAPNNSLEDVYIQGGSSQDGILVGSQGPAYNNVLLNVSGSGLGNVIHICNSTTPSGVCTANANAKDARDLTILGVTCVGSNGICNNNGNTINDAFTGATLTDSSVGMYVVGETAIVNIGNSRFTTSPNTSSAAKAVTWVVGSTVPPTNRQCAAGSLYSCTTGTCTTGTLFECTGNGWKFVK